MRRRARHDGDDQRRVEEPHALGLDAGRVGVGMEPGVDLGDDGARPRARLALENDEAPGCELAVVGNPRGDLQQRFDFGGVGPGTGHGRRRRRAPGLQ